MSNANRKVVHSFVNRTPTHTVYAACGAEARYTDEHAPGVTCKRCLASLAKRDGEFRLKTRRWFGSHAQAQSLANTLRFRADEILHPWAHASRKLNVERAIAREEGRAL